MVVERERRAHVSQLRRRLRADGMTARARFQAATRAHGLAARHIVAPVCSNSDRGDGGATGGGPPHKSDIIGNVGALGDVSGFTNFAADASSEVYTSTQCAALVLACLLGAPAALATAPVPLGEADDFALLAATALAVTDTGGPPHRSDITGNVGALGDVSGFTNFAADASSEFYTSTQVTGRVYTADCAAPTPAMMAQAVSDMKTAYDDAASRSVSALANVDVMDGTIAGKTFVPGVYKWNTYVEVTSDITLEGSADDLYIFQVDGYFVLAADVTVNLVADDTGRGAPQARNIVWQVGEHVHLGENAHFEGTLLVKTNCTFDDSSSLNGRLLVQTSTTLVSKITITLPSPPPPS
ncbi:hypothetical protein T492DRAFT_901784, partial [Pavlovales sp. CCMP2436]